MAGKWHVGGDLWAMRVPSWTLGGPKNPTPRQRGFDRYYGMIDGVAHYFSPHFVMADDGPAEIDPTRFYFTDAITDEAIEMVEAAVAEAKPFFLYLAHAAPHWPLHAHEEDIAKYDGAYGKGWTPSARPGTRRCLRAASCSTAGRSRHAMRQRPPGATPRPRIGRQAAWWCTPQ
jgi:arylsulfatase